MHQKRKYKCRHCRKSYKPYCRTKRKQRYCSRPECRQASHRESQRRWCRKPENREYFCGPEHVQRVQAWRKKNPDWRERRRKKGRVLHDMLILQPTVNQDDIQGKAFVLHDELLMQSPLIVGLVATMAGVQGVLHDEIDPLLRKMQAHGQAIFGMQPQTATKGAVCHECSETSVVSAAVAASAAAVQLGGSSVDSG